MSYSLALVLCNLLSRQRQRKAKSRITRFLEDELWLEVKATIETMPRDTDRACEYFHRVRWLFSLLYICGLRISEVIENTMGAFFVVVTLTVKNGGGWKSPARATRSVWFQQRQNSSWSCPVTVVKMGYRPSLFPANPLPSSCLLAENNAH